MASGKQCLPGTARQMHIWTQQLWQLVQNLRKLKTDKTPAWKRGSGHEVRTLSWALGIWLLLRKCKSVFFNSETPGQPHSRAGPTPKSGWPMRTGLSGGRENMKSDGWSWEESWGSLGEGNKYEQNTLNKILKELIKTLFFTDSLGQTLDWYALFYYIGKEF